MLDAAVALKLVPDGNDGVKNNIVRSVLFKSRGDADGERAFLETSPFRDVCRCLLSAASAAGCVLDEHSGFALEMLIFPSGGDRATQHFPHDAIASAWTLAECAAGDEEDTDDKGTGDARVALFHARGAHVRVCDAAAVPSCELGALVVSRIPNEASDGGKAAHFTYSVQVPAAAQRDGSPKPSLVFVLNVMPPRAAGEVWTTVPVIDVGALRRADASAAEVAAVAAQIHAACRPPGNGFFYAVGHGVDVSALSRVTRDFHLSMTEDEKRELAIRAYNPASTRERNGYYMAVPGKKANESFCFLNPRFHAEHPAIRAGCALHEVNRWPDEARHPGFREFQERFFFDMCDLSRAILRGFAASLGLAATHFDGAMSADDTMSAVSLIRYPKLEQYPPTPVAADGLRLSFKDHYDVSVLTVLYQSDVANLQVFTPDGWRSLPANDEAFLVNGGTFMELMTNAYYPSPLHRVKWVNEERQSLPFFAQFGSRSVVQSVRGPGVAAADAGEAPQAFRFGPDYYEKEFYALIARNGQT